MLSPCQTFSLPVRQFTLIEPMRQSTNQNVQLKKNIYNVDTRISNSSWASTLHKRLSKMFRLNKLLKNKRQRCPAEEKIVGEMLMGAITTQKFKLARIMITGGVDVNFSVSGLTPLMIACLIPLKSDNEDKHQLIELLLECGANLNARDNFSGTALHYAHMCCCSRTTRCMQKHKSGTKIGWRNYH